MLPWIWSGRRIRLPAWSTVLKICNATGAKGKVFGFKTAHSIAGWRILSPAVSGSPLPDYDKFGLDFQRRRENWLICYHPVLVVYRMWVNGTLVVVYNAILVLEPDNGYEPVALPANIGLERPLEMTIAVIVIFVREQYNENIHFFFCTSVFNIGFIVGKCEVNWKRVAPRCV